MQAVVERYNNRDNLTFASEVTNDFINELSDEIIRIIKELEEDKKSGEALGISFEEKAFYDILIKVRDTHEFEYDDDKCIVLAKKIKELVDDKARYRDFLYRDDIKSSLSKDLTVLLYQNGYPPQWNKEVFEQVLEQAENFQKYQ
jgi:type I restriction enzyme R subunit